MVLPEKEHQILKISDMCYHLAVSEILIKFRHPILAQDMMTTRINSIAHKKLHCHQGCGNYRRKVIDNYFCFNTPNCN